MSRMIVQINIYFIFIQKKRLTRKAIKLKRITEVRQGFCRLRRVHGRQISWQRWNILLYLPHTSQLQTSLFSPLFLWLTILLVNPIRALCKPICRHRILLENSYKSDKDKLTQWMWQTRFLNVRFWALANSVNDTHWLAVWMIQAFSNYA